MLLWKRSSLRKKTMEYRALRSVRLVSWKVSSILTLSTSRKLSTKKIICTLSSNTANLTSRNTCAALEDHCQLRRLRNLLTKSYRQLHTAMLTELCIVTLSLRTYWSTRMEMWSWQILVLREHLGSLSKHILMKLLRYGIEHLKFCLDAKNTQHLLTFGQSVASSQRWPNGKLSLLVIQRSIKFSKSSKFKEHQMRHIGQRL